MDCTRGLLIYRIQPFVAAESAGILNTFSMFVTKDSLDRYYPEHLFGIRGMTC